MFITNKCSPVTSTVQKTKKPSVRRFASYQMSNNSKAIVNGSCVFSSILKFMNFKFLYEKLS